MDRRIERALELERANRQFHAEEQARFHAAMQTEEEFNASHEVVFDHCYDVKKIDAELMSGTILGWSTGYGIYTIQKVDTEEYTDKWGDVYNYAIVLSYKGEEIERKTRSFAIAEIDIREKVLRRI